MKQIKLISAVLLIATMFLSFNACSSDDDDDYDFNSSTNGKRITKIVNEYSDFIRTETFSYANGKMTRHTAKYNDDITYENDQTITYTTNTVVLKGRLDASECEQTYTLNSNGLATSCKIVYSDNSQENYTFQYADGYLTGMSYIYSDENSSETETYTFTYSNENMTQASYKSKYDNENYTFTYTSHENKGAVINEFLEYELFQHRAAFYMGILGKVSKNLVKSNGEQDFVYSLDNDGYINTAISSENKFTYTFE